MMKVRLLLSALTCLALIYCTTSCESKKTSKENTSTSFANTLTAADTTDVLNLAAQCMELLKGNNTEEALQMMHVMIEGKPVQISEEQKQKLKNKFRMFPVLLYDLESYNFTSETDNIIKYRIAFFVHKDKEDKTPNTIGFMFVPVRIDKKWYLTIPETS